MFNNNAYNPGYFYNQAQQYQAARKPRFTNPVTPDDRKLFNAQAGFSLFVDDKEVKRATCTHKDGDTISLKLNPDGTHTCWICGKTFELVDASQEAVAEITNQYLNVLESIKTYYLDIPESVVKEFFQMIPFIAKTPEIYKLAVDNFHSYEGPMTNAFNQGNQFFNMFDAINSPNYMYNPYQQQPMGYGMPQAPQYVPQGYTAPQPMPMGAQPVGGFGYVDNGMAPGTVPVQTAPPVSQPVVSPIPQPGNANAAQTNPTDVVNQTKTFAL